MKKLLSFFAAIVLSATFVQAGNYSLNNDAIDQLIEDAVEVSIMETASGVSDMNALGMNGAAGTLDVVQTKESSAVVALLLNTVYYFTGIGGIHRWYLGSSMGTYIIYFCTAGGFGCLQGIDWIMLLIEVITGNGKIDTYSDNDSIFMWKS